MSTTSGWGRFTWGQAYWNADTTLKTGWGAKSWGEDEWNELKDAVAQPSGLSITSSVGSVDVPDVILTLTGQSFTASQGEAFNPVVTEGVSASFSIGSLTVDDVHQGLTSSAITSSIGVKSTNSAGTSKASSSSPPKNEHP